MINPISYWREQQKEYQYLDKIGRIISFTKINNPSKGFGRRPYYAGIIEFKNQDNRTGQLVLEGKKPKIKGKAIGVIRIIGKSGKNEIINYGIKFKLI